MPSRRAEATSLGDRLLALQRQAGNRAVAGLVPGVVTVQRHLGNTEAESLMTAAGGGGSTPPYAKRLAATPGALPKLLSAIKAHLEAGRGAEAKAELLGARKSGMPESMPKNAAAQKELTDRSSGAGVEIFSLAPDVHDFMSSLFELIEASHKGTQLNEMDLFHGHLFMNGAQKELGIIFHAKEYPTELSTATTKPFQETPTTGKPTAFSMEEDSFQERNFMWLMSSNSLWMLGSDKERATGFSSLMTGPTAEQLQDWKRYKELEAKYAESATDDDEESEMFELYPKVEPIRQQMKAGTVESQNFGEELLDVNYFKTAPGRPLFFRGGRNAPGRAST